MVLVLVGTSTPIPPTMRGSPPTVRLWLAMLLLLFTAVSVTPAQTILPGTKPFTFEGDPAAGMVDAIHAFLLRETAASAERRAALRTAASDPAPGLEDIRAGADKHTTDTNSPHKAKPERTGLLSNKHQCGGTTIVHTCQRAMRKEYGAQRWASGSDPVWRTVRLSRPESSRGVARIETDSELLEQHLRAKYSLLGGVGAPHAPRAELVRSPL